MFTKDYLLPIMQYGVDAAFTVNNPLDNARYGGYPYEDARAPNSAGAGSTALYHHNGTRYGLSINGRSPAAADSKMNGLHGPKHKRGDMDRECKSSFAFSVE